MNQCVQNSAFVHQRRLLLTLKSYRPEVSGILKAGDVFSRAERLFQAALCLVKLCPRSRQNGSSTQQTSFGQTFNKVLDLDHNKQSCF
eukprot:6190583-Pleurochrysis_carterae.AAC.1